MCHLQRAVYCITFFFFITNCHQSSVYNHTHLSCGSSVGRKSREAQLGFSSTFGLSQLKSRSLTVYLLIWKFRERICFQLHSFVCVFVIQFIAIIELKPPFFWQTVRDHTSFRLLWGSYSVPSPTSATEDLLHIEFLSCFQCLGFLLLLCQGKMPLLLKDSHD